MTVLIFTRHKLVVHENCDRPHCYICEGGLAYCATCGGAEASMPTHCPQRRMTCEEIEAVQDGSIDFVQPRGWTRADGVPKNWNGGSSCE